MYLTTRGLVLRVTPYKDTDALLTVLTGEYGKLTVKARGLRRKNSPLAAPCQLLAYGEFTLFEYKSMFTVNEAHTIELFPQIHKDLELLALGTYFAQAADVLSQEDVPNPELLSLVMNCLYILSQKKTDMRQIKSVFELRLACISGYAPDLSGCHICSGEAADRFDISEGRLECHRCRDLLSHGIRLPISAGTLDAMRYICFCDPKRLFSFSVADSTLDELSSVSESYLTTQLERGFSALDFYKSLTSALPQ